MILEKQYVGNFPWNFYGKKFNVHVLQLNFYGPSFQVFAYLVEILDNSAVSEIYVLLGKFHLLTKFQPKDCLNFCVLSLTQPLSKERELSLDIF